MKLHSSAKWVLALAAASTLMGCSRTRIREGFVMEEELVAQIQPGIDNKQSVEAMLGPPSFESQFGGNEWFYVSRELRQIAFRTPKPTDEDLVRVSFNQAGTVVAVNHQTGLDNVAKIDPENDSTETIDGKDGFFDDLFDGVGGSSVGGGQGSGDPTSPN